MTIWDLLEDTMFKHILLPSDGSDLALRVVDKAIEFAREIDAKVTGFYAQPEYSVPYYEGGMPFDAMTPEAFADFTAGQAKNILAAIADKASAAGVKHELYTVVNDSPYQAIIEAANARGCDLIFMASHGRRGIAGMLMGSETHKVLTHTKIPVLVYR
jgi:nucleotide-binding universal stress UspA family protein